MAGNKVAIVTGGSSGNGLAFTRRLLEKSYIVVVVARNQQKFDALSLGPACEFQKADVRDWTALSKAFGFVYDKFGHIDVVGANAGIGEEPPLFWDNLKAAAPVKPNMSVLDVNLIGVIHTVTLAIHCMRKQKEAKQDAAGKIVVTGSAVSVHAEVTEPVYVSAKHGVAGVVRAASPVLARDGITINAVCPSFTLTPMSQPYTELIPSYLWSDQKHVVAAFERFVDTDINGALLEVTHEGTFDRSQPYPDRAAEWIEGSLPLME